MRVLLTGSAGFIGFHAAKKLLERGDEIIGVDNLNDYYDVSLKENRNAVLLKNKKYIFYRINIADKDKLFEIFEKEKPDRVIHLAAQAGVRHSLLNPYVYEETNVKGFLNILEACRKYKILYLTYASSASVYGNNVKLPFSETDRVDNPISLYAVTKKSNEEMAFAYHHLYGINVTGLRFFTAYGPFGRPDVALLVFAKAISEGKPIKLFNSGNMLRDFTYVSDIVDGIIAALDKGYACEIINLARGEVRTLLEFVQIIEKELGKSALVEYLPMQPGDIPKASADISKAVRLLGYSPKVSIEEGIHEVIKWYLSYYNKK